MAGENPLFNQLILGNILNQGNLSFSDLKSFRLVCKDWFQASLPTWRRTAILRVAFGGHRRRGVSTFKEFVDSIDDSRKAQFNQLDRYPFNKVRFARCDLSLDTLWEKIRADLLVYLHFHQCCFIEPGMAADVVVAKIIFEKCPNLKTLKMTNNAMLPKQPRQLFKSTKMEQMKSEQEGFHLHKSLEDVLISSGIPEKLVVLLPLAVNLKSEVIVLATWPFRYKMKAEDGTDSSEPSTVGQRMLNELYAESTQVVLPFEVVFPHLAWRHGDI